MPTVSQLHEALKKYKTGQVMPFTAKTEGTTTSSTWADFIESATATTATMNNYTYDATPASYGYVPKHMRNISKKIGLNLGIEYLVRSGAIKSFATFPCSIFLKSPSKRVVVTITKANSGHTDDCTMYCVRNWFISSCEKDQPIPDMKEVIVKDVDLCSDPSVILKGFVPIYFECKSTEWKKNRGNNGHPMPDYIYKNCYDNMLTPLSHEIKKLNFLWLSFTKTYIPAISMLVNAQRHHPSYRRSDDFDEQRKMVEGNFKNIWQSWLKWKKFMIFDGVQGELIFMRDYMN